MYQSTDESQTNGRAPVKQIWHDVSRLDLNDCCAVTDETAVGVWMASNVYKAPPKKRRSRCFGSSQKGKEPKPCQVSRTDGPRISSTAIPDGADFSFAKLLGLVTASATVISQLSKFITQQWYIQAIC